MRRLFFALPLSFLVLLTLGATVALAPLTARAGERVATEPRKEKIKKTEEEKKREAEEEEHAKEKEGGKKKKGAPQDGEISGGHFDGDPIYIHLKPLVLPIVNDSGAQQIVTLQIDLQIRDFDTADSMHSNMPRVRDSIMRALYGGLGNGSLRNGNMLDVDRIKTRVQRALDETFGKNTIQNVLIQAFAQRTL